MWLYLIRFKLFSFTGLVVSRAVANGDTFPISPLSTMMFGTNMQHHACVNTLRLHAEFWTHHVWCHGAHIEERQRGVMTNNFSVMEYSGVCVCVYVCRSAFTDTKPSMSNFLFCVTTGQCDSVIMRPPSREIGSYAVSCPNADKAEMSRPSSQTSQLALKPGVACPKAVERQRGGSEKKSSRDRDWGPGEGVILWRVGAMQGNRLHLLPFKPAGHSFVGAALQSDTSQWRERRRTETDKPNTGFKGWPFILQLFLLPPWERFWRGVFCRLRSETSPWDATISRHAGPMVYPSL